MLHRWINCEHFWFQFGLPTLGLQDLERCPGLLVLCELALRRRNARSSCWNYELQGRGSLSQGTGIRVRRCCLESDLLLTAPHWKYSSTANENVLFSLATC